MKNPLRLLLAPAVGASLLLFSPAAHAKLGENLDQLAQRFGAAYTVEEHGAATVAHFRTPGRLRAGAVLVGGVCIAEIYYSVLPLDRNGHPPEDAVQAILKTNVPGARWKTVPRPDEGEDEERRTDDEKHLASLHYRGVQAEGATWIMLVARVAEMRAVAKDLGGGASPVAGGAQTDPARHRLQRQNAARLRELHLGQSPALALGRPPRR